MSLSWHRILSLFLPGEEQSDEGLSPRPPAHRAVVVPCSVECPSPPVLSPCHGTVITGGINTRRCLCIYFSPWALFSCSNFPVFLGLGCLFPRHGQELQGELCASRIPKKHLSWLHSHSGPKLLQAAHWQQSGLKANKILIFLQIFGNFNTKRSEFSVSLQDVQHCSKQGHSLQG